MSADGEMISQCAACGKGGDALKKCTSCKMVKYCSAGCEEEHRTEHEEECRKRAAELFDETLFKDHLPQEECPVCFLPLPINNTQITYQSCCGKLICRGCLVAAGQDIGDWPPCPFCCREPLCDNEEEIRRLRTRVEANDPEAFMVIAHHYHNGRYGLPQDSNKAVELWLTGAELGSVSCCYKLGAEYYEGWGVERDRKKGIHYTQLAAMGGHVRSRFNLGVMEKEAGNTDRALKHWMIAARAGCDDSLKLVKKGYKKGLVAKDDFANALRAHQKATDEMKSENRDKAAQG